MTVRAAARRSDDRTNVLIGRRLVRGACRQESAQPRGNGCCDRFVGERVPPSIASHHRHRMGRLVVVIDANNSQVDGSIASVTTIEPLAEKWRSFGWLVEDVDGHDTEALSRAFASAGRQTVSADASSFGARSA